jgi:hypothetical protein
MMNQRIVCVYHLNPLASHELSQVPQHRQADSPRLFTTCDTYASFAQKPGERPGAAQTDDFYGVAPSFQLARKIHQHAFRAANFQIVDYFRNPHLSKFPDCMGRIRLHTVCHQIRLSHMYDVLHPLLCFQRTRLLNYQEQHRRRQNRKNQRNRKQHHNHGRRLELTWNNLAQREPDTLKHQSMQQIVGIANIAQPPQWRPAKPRPEEAGKD